MREWTTVGVHANVVEASWQALVDALVYALRPTESVPSDSLGPVTTCHRGAGTRRTDV